MFGGSALSLPFRYEFSTNLVLEDALRGSHFMSVELSSGEKLRDILRLFESSGHAQCSLGRLLRAVTHLNMCCSPSICKVSLQGRTSVNQNVILIREELTAVDCFTCLFRCLTRNNNGGQATKILEFEYDVRGFDYCHPRPPCPIGSPRLALKNVVFCPCCSLQFSGASFE